MAELKLVKIGGNVIENREALADFLEDFAALNGPKVLVHGGGKEATQMAKKLGLMFS
jgi:acetylglutamate kinase